MPPPRGEADRKRRVGRRASFGSSNVAAAEQKEGDTAITLAKRHAHLVIIVGTDWFGVCASLVDASAP